VPESVAVNIRNRPHTVTAYVRTDEEPVEGVLVSQGSVLGGWSFHAVDGNLCFVHNLAGWRVYRVDAPLPASLAPGAHTLAVHFDPPHATLLVDGEVVGEGEIKRTLWSRLSLTNAGLTVGWATDFSAADTDYRGRFEFTGAIDRVEIDVSGDPFVDAEAEARDVIAAQ
jgi:Concanavalin A-like lectin/glucanases superfamily